MTRKGFISIIVIIVVIIAAIVGIAWYWHSMTVQQQQPAQQAAGAPITSPDLGSSIYEKSTNPVEGKLPSTVSPVENPMEGAYKNPFE